MEWSWRLEVAYIRFDGVRDRTEIIRLEIITSDVYDPTPIRLMNAFTLPQKVLKGRRKCL